MGLLQPLFMSELVSSFCLIFSSRTESVDVSEVDSGFSFSWSGGIGSGLGAVVALGTVSGFPVVVVVDTGSGLVLVVTV